MDPQLLMQGGIAVFAVIAGYILLSGDSSEKARQRVAEVSGTQKEGTFAFLKKEDQQSSRRKQIEESLTQMEQAQKDKSKQRKSLKSRLIQANWTMTPQVYLIISALVGLLVTGTAFLFFPSRVLILVGAGVGTGYILPRFILNMAIKRRQKKFLAGFPDAMDIIVRGVRSGLPLGDCLKVIAHESPEPIAGEFKLVVQGEQVGVPIEVCLERLYERMPLPEVNFFGTVLAIQRSSGGNLGEALGNLSTVLRGRKLLREKIKALSAEAKASAIIVGSLPPLIMIVVTLIQPEYMYELYYTPTGHRNLMISAGMMVTGTLIMRKMINFKF